MRTVPHHYQSEAESLSGWQDQVESSPVGFGDGRSLLTEKKNTVQENTEILNKVYGNRNSLGAAAYKLDGYSKQALSKKSWLNQNKKKQGKRLVRTKKSASKHSSPRHHTSPKEKLEREREREREREWQDGPGLAKPSTLERKTSTSSARKSRHSPPRPPPPQDLFEVAISGHFLQKMVLNAWYAENVREHRKPASGPPSARQEAAAPLRRHSHHLAEGHRQKRQAAAPGAEVQREQQTKARAGGLSVVEAESRIEAERPLFFAKVQEVRSPQKV